jgi:hypothetical protein
MSRHLPDRAMISSDNRARCVHIFTGMPVCLSALLLPLLTGCASVRGGNFPIDSASRPAVETPPAFTFEAAAGEVASRSTCRNPARDPRDGTRLVLTRSSGGRGDYEVPAGRYGVGRNEYLRLDCASGEAVGVVRR